MEKEVIECLHTQSHYEIDYRNRLVTCRDYRGAVIERTILSLTKLQKHYEQLENQV